MDNEIVVYQNNQLVPIEEEIPDCTGDLYLSLFKGLVKVAVLIGIIVLIRIL